MTTRVCEVCSSTEVARECRLCAGCGDEYRRSAAGNIDTFVGMKKIVGRFDSNDGLLNRLAFGSAPWFSTASARAALTEGSTKSDVLVVPAAFIPDYKRASAWTKDSTGHWSCRSGPLLCVYQDQPMTAPLSDRERSFLCIGCLGSIASFSYGGLCSNCNRDRPGSMTYAQWALKKREEAMVAFEPLPTYLGSAPIDVKPLRREIRIMPNGAELVTEHMPDGSLRNRIRQPLPSGAADYYDCTVGPTLT